MHWLDHKIPPPIVGAFAGAVMWGIAQVTPAFQIQAPLRLAIAAVFFAIGLAIILLGGAAFRRVGTTVNPLKPETTSSLVVTGIYRYTRNPMYVGFASVLIGWAVCLEAPLALIGLVFFVLFITRFQIIPEERELNAKFGQEFIAYRERVRRWL
jgi:protein-S-isoprenylcysteine O-methyltransferase Ste14